MVSKEPHFFTAEIDASQGALGLKLSEDGVTVASVDEGGLADQWNALHSSKIAPGVEVRAINGSWNPIRMLEELQEAKTLKLDLWKPRMRKEVKVLPRNVLGAEPVLLLQQRIDVEEKRREEAIEQLTSFMTEAITTVSNRMEELALTHLKSQQQQDSAMQGLTQRLIEVQESDNAQIHQLKQLDEIQSGATQQISRIEAKHQELFHGLNELSSETKTCIGQLNEAVRGILEDAGALERLRKRASQSLQREDDQDTLADTIKTDSDRTVLPAGSLERQDSQKTQSLAGLASFEPPIISAGGASGQWQTRTGTSPALPVRPVQPVSPVMVERPQVTGSIITPRKPEVYARATRCANLERATGAAEAGCQMFSPRKMPQVPPLNWPSQPLMHSPMPSPRFTSPVRSPRIAAIRTLSPQPMQTWQMRASVPAKPGKTANSKQEALQALQTADSQSRVDNSILTPRVDNSLPATERARRVTSPTRNEAK